MKKIPMNETNRLETEGIQGFFVKTVTRFGTSAKVDCPREFIGTYLCPSVSLQFN